MYPSESYPGSSSAYRTDLGRASPPMIVDNTRPTIDAFSDHTKIRSKASDMDIDMPRMRARTLGGDHVRESGPVREIRIDNEISSGSRPLNVRFRDGWKDHVLSVPSIKTFLSVRVDGTEDVLEGANFEGGRT